MMLVVDVPYRGRYFVIVKVTTVHIFHLLTITVCTLPFFLGQFQELPSLLSADYRTNEAAADGESVHYDYARSERFGRSSDR